MPQGFGIYVEQPGPPGTTQYHEPLSQHVAVICKVATSILQADARSVYSQVRFAFVWSLFFMIYDVLFSLKNNYILLFDCLVVSFFISCFRFQTSDTRLSYVVLSFIKSDTIEKTSKAMIASKVLEAKPSRLLPMRVGNWGMQEVAPVSSHIHQDARANAKTIH